MLVRLLSDIEQFQPPVNLQAETLSQIHFHSLCHAEQSAWLFLSLTYRADAMDKTIWDLVVDDMKGRDQFGFRKYGRHLELHDGRDTLRDAYEEALDLAVYLKKAMMERDTCLASSTTRTPPITFRNQNHIQTCALIVEMEQRQT